MLTISEWMVLLGKNLSVVLACFLFVMLKLEQSWKIIPPHLIPLWGKKGESKLVTKISVFSC